MLSLGHRIRSPLWVSFQRFKFIVDDPAPAELDIHLQGTISRKTIPSSSTTI
jgi:hypothetical protein